MDTQDIPTIPEVFNNKIVLITGATGFLGKVLLEKLLRSCPGIKKILILTRGEKLPELWENRVFDRIKSECPEALGKVRSVHGDVTEYNCGFTMDPEIEETSFVFHCAASVRFEDNPRTLLQINVKGVESIMMMCEKFENLEAVVHVSTAYSFCNQPIISEETYFEQPKPRNLIQAAQYMDDYKLARVCSVLNDSRPSLYQYSKAIAEILIERDFSHLPVVIVRPSIITAAAKEPFPGWIDNYNGPSGFIALSCKGMLKTLMVKHGVNADWVPVDLVANTLIAAACHIALQRNGTLDLKLDYPDEIPIINCVCPETNLIKWSEVVDMCIPLLYKYPSSSCYRLPGGVVTSSRTLHTIAKYLSHYLPAFIIDCYRFISGNERKMIRTYQRIHGVMNHLQLYTTEPFIFTSRRMDVLVQQMHAKDKGVFPIDQSSLKWPQYLEDYVHGVRRYYLGEDDVTLLSSRNKLSRLQACWFYGRIVSVGILFFILIRPRNMSTVLSFIPVKAASKTFHCISCLPSEKLLG